MAWLVSQLAAFGAPHKYEASSLATTPPLAARGTSEGPGFPGSLLRDKWGQMGLLSPRPSPRGVCCALTCLPGPEMNEGEAREVP